MPSPEGAAPFGRVGIAGVGLIGGSIAAAVRAVWPQVAITGLDRPDVLTAAAAADLIDTRGRSVDDLIDLDLIVLAAPVPEILTLIPQVARLGPRALVTDVGSTKRHILRGAASADLSHFIGGHPMAGAERPGLEHARADLFHGQPWVLTPGAAVPDDAITRLERFVVEGMGAVPRRLDADTHDRTVAYISHLPQLLAVALMNTAGGAVGEAGLALSGRAFGEMTRLASSPADLWEGILATNADYVAEAAAAMAAELPTRASLHVTQWIEETFHQSGEWRRKMTR